MLQPISPSRAQGGPRNLGPARDRVELLGVAIDRVDFEETLRRVEAFIAEGTPHHIATVNLDYLRLASRDAAFSDLLNGVDLAVADGMPLVWASRWRRQPLPGRVTGLDLFQSICEASAQRGWSVFLLGAAPGIAHTAAATMAQRYPGLRVAGTYSPPAGRFDDLEEQHIRNLIREANPQVLFVALGAPRQDWWIHANLRLGVPISIGVGGTFDVVSGVRPRAPRWMQRLGLEWSFRLLQEPRRLWRRYLLQDLPAFWRLALDARRSRRQASATKTAPGAAA